MITFGNKQICEYCLTEGSGKTCRVCGFDKTNYKKEWGVLPPGSILSGKYIVGKIIGQGGFGITYLAYDTKHEKKVALKEYYPVTYSKRGEDGVTVAASRAEDAELYKSGMEKFYEEASLVSRFNGNPNIVSVYEFFYENDTAYFVMELLRGISLKAYIDEHGCLSPEETLYIADKVSNALMVTHSANTLHRDISPDNIMLCADGNVKIIDFGAARQVAADNPKSMSVILKQGFAPLEQYQRRGKQGPWTDLYSLGATLYYTQTKVCLDDPMSRSDDDSEFQSNSFNIEPQLWEVIRHSLNIKIDERYKDAFEFRTALDKIEYKSKAITVKLPEEETVPLTPTPLTEQGAAVYPAEKKPLNKKLIAILSGAMGIVIVAVITVIAVALGGKRGSIDTKPDGNNYQQTSTVQSAFNGQSTSETGGTGGTGSASSTAVSTPATSPSALTSSSTSSQTPATSSSVSTSSSTGSQTPVSSSSASKSSSMSSQTPVSSSSASKSSSTSSQTPVSSSSKSSSTSSQSSTSSKPASSSSTSTTTSSSSTPVPSTPTTVTIKGKSYSTSLTELDLSNQGLTSSDIADLKLFKNLQTLNLNGNNVSDISVLANCTSLTRLALTGNGISDISPLAKCTKLTTLYINENNISNVSALSKCTALDTLYLDKNKLTNISGLEYCNKIRVLHINNNSISDISGLAKLTALSSLYLNNTNVSDISALKNLKGLSIVYLDGTAVNDLSPLQNCKLNTLHIANMRVSDKTLFRSTLERLRMVERGIIFMFDTSDVRASYIFPSLDDIQNCKSAIVKNSGISTMSLYGYVSMAWGTETKVV